MKIMLANRIAPAGTPRLSGSPESISLLVALLPSNLTSFLKVLSIFRYNLSFGNMNLFFDVNNCYCSTLLPTKIWNGFEINCPHLASFKLSDTHFIISVTVYEVLDNVLEVRSNSACMYSSLV